MWIETSYGDMVNLEKLEWVGMEMNDRGLYEVVGVGAVSGKKHKLFFNYEPHIVKRWYSWVKDVLRREQVD